ncbi:MAG: hypothetical protein FJ333_03110 [Sphingomonadales bacterium]|nr:hypothetical protein [Sphingomonadales bacterium]
MTTRTTTTVRMTTMRISMTTTESWRTLATTTWRTIMTATRRTLTVIKRTTKSMVAIIRRSPLKNLDLDP